MLVGQLNELQEKLAAGLHLEDAECTFLLTELWRLKASLASKVIERDVASDERVRVQAALDEANATIASLRRELELLQAVHDLETCPLERRWSNCAARTRKQSSAQ